MSRRKKAKRNTTVSQGLASAMRQILSRNPPPGLSQPRLMDGIISEIFAPPARKVSPFHQIEHWLDSVNDIIDALPEEFDDFFGFTDAQCTFDRIYEGGEIQGTVEHDGETFEVFVNCGDGDPPAGCSCEASNGELPCRHIVEFLGSLNEVLYDRRTKVCQTINRGDFTPGIPRREQYRPDRGLLAIRRLDEVLQRAIGKARTIVEEDPGLPDLVVAPTERLVWSVSTAGGKLEMTPLLQQQKKRGNGFTQGRKLPLDRLKYDPNLPLAPHDQAIVNKIEFRPGRYGSDYLLHPLVVLENLVGQSNLVRDSEPLEVIRRELFVSLKSQEEEFSFALGFDGVEGAPGVLCSDETRFAYLLKSKPLVIVGRLPACGYKLIQSLLGMSPVSGKHTEAFFEKVRRLQAFLPLRLPEEVGGPIVSQPFRPALLLRCRADGSLDYGLRVRIHDGQVSRPGQDAITRPDVVDGKPVQRVRDTVAELDRCRKLAEKLGLSAAELDGWNGSIREFESGLRLLEALPTLGDDVEVLWDERGEKPMSMLGTLTSKNVRVDITSKRNWFGLSGTCDFGGHTMSLDKLLQSLPSHGDTDAVRGDYIRVAEGQWAKVSESLRKRLEQLRDVTHENRKSLAIDATAAPAIRDLMESDIEVQATKNWMNCLASLSRAEQLDPHPPSGLQATFRDYQLEGYRWLRRLAEWGVGGILADDMGLGKTLQALAVLLDRAEEGPALVIAPTSVGFNWVREAERFTPGLRPHLYRETERAEFLGEVGPGDLVVCSYALALRDEAALAKVKWGTLVMDEAQAVKNSRSKTAQAIAGFESKWTVALTGTPVENHLGELWSLFHLISPGVFGGWDQFRRRFAAPIEKQECPEARTALATRLQPFVLRRTKSQVLTELPPRTEMNLYVEQSPEERQQYERVRLSALGEIDQIAALDNIQDQRFKLLALLTRLRQFACHPGIVNKQWIGSSAKLDQLCETMEELKEEGHRALIFSQFTQHLDLIRGALDARQISYQYLDGSTPAHVRQQRVDAFQAGEGDAFLISLKAGGTGLNLTAADYVIHMDPWWNPAVEDQATDRAHRIGQDKPVMVYRIITRGTIEEEILSLHDSKRNLVAGVLEGTTAAAKLSTSELIEMLRSSAG